MISLPKLLLEAAGRKASEVVLEPGERPAATTPGGRESFGEPLEESELFEALTGVLAPEQQAELAVGNVVEFRVASPTGEWTMLVEPSLDGMVLRGRRGVEQAKADPEVSAPMDLPKLAPFQPEQVRAAPAPEPVLKRSTRVDLGLTQYAEDKPPWEGAPKSEPPPPAEPAGADGKSPLPPPPPVADLGPSRESGVDFAIVPDGVDASNAAAEAPIGSERPTGKVAAEPLASQNAAASGTAPPETPPLGVPRRTPVTTVPRDELAALLARFGPGTLCFSTDRGLSEELAQAAGEPVSVLDEPSAVDLAGRMLDELAAGTTYVVRLEDPSRITAWALRRLEEGSRVVVETRARDIAGARRIFVGLHGPAAERWLAEHPVIWLAGEGGRWRVEGDLPPGARSGRGNGEAASTPPAPPPP